MIKKNLIISIIFAIIGVISLGMLIRNYANINSLLKESEIKIALLEEEKKGLKKERDSVKGELKETLSAKDKLNNEVLELIEKLKKKPKVIIKKVTEIKTIEVDKKKFVSTEDYKKCQEAWVECAKERTILIEAFGKNYNFDLSLKENINKLFKLNLELELKNEEQFKEYDKMTKGLKRRIKLYKYGGIIVLVLGLMATFAK